MKQQEGERKEWNKKKENIHSSHASTSSAPVLSAMINVKIPTHCDNFTY